MKQGWETKKLGELVNIKTGKLDSNAMVDGGKYPFFTCSREVFAINDYAFDCEAILLAGNNASGDFNVKHYKGKFNAYQRTYVITVNSENKILYSYLYHQLTNHLKKFKEQSVGANTKFLKIGMIQGMEIPLPSLPEQRRIVAILDEAFTAIAKAKANAEQNLKNAKELFESYLQGVFENKGEGWEEKTLGEIADVIGGYSFKSTDFQKEGKYQVLRMGNVRPGIIRENESPVFIDKIDEKVLAKALLLPNDVIITQTGTNKKRDYGFTVIIEKENYLLNQRIAAIRFSDNYLSRFFLYFSWTNIFKDQYFANETGTVGQGNVGIGAITNAIVPFPPIKEQQTVVQKLDALSAETKKLEAIYQQKINDLEELKKSVLQKAFSGELRSPEGAKYTSDEATPIAKKKTITSPERA